MSSVSVHVKTLGWRARRWDSMQHYWKCRRDLTVAVAACWLTASRSILEEHVELRKCPECEILYDRGRMPSD